MLLVPLPATEEHEGMQHAADTEQATTGGAKLLASGQPAH